MKEQKKKKRRGALYHSNNRWKWMAGATAATAAGGITSQASLVTIDLSGNLNPDLTGDGHPDMTIVHVYDSDFYLRIYRLNGVTASRRYRFETPYFLGYMRVGSQTAYYRRNHYTLSGKYHSTVFGTPSLKGSIPIFFKDLRINGGAPTSGSLQVTVSPLSIVLDSLTYNGPNSVRTPGHAVPDQGSSLALLAMGAGGILSFRRWRRVAKAD
jgi:hypothetical protein